MALLCCSPSCVCVYVCFRWTPVRGRGRRSTGAENGRFYSAHPPPHFLFGLRVFATLWQPKNDAVRPPAYPSLLGTVATALLWLFFWALFRRLWGGHHLCTHNFPSVDCTCAQSIAFSTKRTRSDTIKSNKTPSPSLPLFSSLNFTEPQSQFTLSYSLCIHQSYSVMFDHQNKDTWLSAKERPRAALRPIISPSILASDFANLKAECASVLSHDGGSCEWLHIDVMDGHFVRNLTIGPCVVESLRKHFPHVFLDVHLMIADPDLWVPEFAKAGASQYTFHAEASPNLRATIANIRGAGMQCGLALKPGTDVTDEIKQLLSEGLIDMILVMTVEPGFGGQSFMPEMMLKVKALRTAYPHLNIQVDGGLSEKTIEVAASAGANVIVAGTAIFRAVDRKVATEALRSAVAAHL